MSKILARWVEAAIAGKGILQNVSNFGLEVEVTANKGLGFSGSAASDTLEVLINDSTIGFNGSGELEIKADSVGPTQIDETATYNFSSTSNVIKAASPSTANDVAIKSYVDGLITGLSWKEPVDEIATDSDALVGTPVAGYRVLVAGVGVNDFATHDNTIAVRNSTNDGWDFLTPSANWAVLDKTTDSGYTYDLETTSWVQFTGAGQINAGDGLTKTGNTLDVDLASNKGLEFISTQLAVKLDTTKGLDFNGYGKIVAVVDGSNIIFNGGQITLDVDHLAGEGLVNNGSGALAVSFGQGVTLSGDDVTVFLNANGGLVKNLGTGTNELGVNTGSGLEVSSNAVRIAASAAGAGLTGGAGSPLAVEVTANKGLGFSTVGDAGTLEVKVDATTIGFNAGVLEVIDGSIGASKLNLADNYTWTGNHDFTGGSIVATTQTQGDSSTSVATTAYVDTAVSSVTGEQARIEYLTLNGTDITNKYKDLAVAPKTAGYTCVDVIGAGAQQYTLDFTVITDGSVVKRLNWNALGLDGTVVSGTVLRVMYTVDA